MLSQFSSRCVRLVGMNRKIVLAALLALSATASLSAPSANANEKAYAALFTNRAWYEDYGSFGNQLFGRVYVMTTKPGSVSGWNSGFIYKVQGTMISPIAFPVNWKPTANGIIIDHLTTTVEGVRVLQINEAAEVMAVTHSNWGGRQILSSTRSRSTPQAIRQAFYK